MEPFKPVLTTSFRDQFAPQTFTADNAQLYVASNIGRDKVAIVLVDPATAQEEQQVYARDDVDVGGLVWSRARKRAAYVPYETAKPERHYLDPDAAALFGRLEEQLPGYEITVQSVTDDESRMIVAATSDRTQGTRYLYDRKSGVLTRLGDVTPWLPEASMAAMKPISYMSRDALTIHGYLTLPTGAAARNLPVVVNPHGGPWARDGWGFNPEAQFLANRGYAVLQMNYRGSTGYGRKFWEASFKQWGFAMQDDITDGVRWLVEEGIADPRRICIYGGSYGGYATLAGLTQTPDLYACGVDYVGVSNLFTFMQTIPPYWKPYLAMLHEMVGDPEVDKALMTAASPALNAQKIKVPLLVAQGARDPRVNKDESDQMVAALKARGIDVPYIVKDNEGHGFRNEENQFEFYAAMETFLDRSTSARRRSRCKVATALWIIVPAAGGGARFGAAPPKQYVDLGRGTDARAHAERLRGPSTGPGSSSRSRRATRFRGPVGSGSGSRRCAVAAIPVPRRCATRSRRWRDHCGDGDWVLVHDAARPCVPRDALRASSPDSPTIAVGGLLALPLADTLKRAGPASRRGRIADG